MCLCSYVQATNYILKFGLEQGEAAYGRLCQIVILGGLSRDDIIIGGGSVIWHQTQLLCALLPTKQPPDVALSYYELFLALIEFRQRVATR